MDTYIDFVSRLIYGTGAEAAVTPNHRDWLAANPSPTGTQWMAHHLDALLPALEGWLSSHNLPPMTPWDGTRPAPWDASQDIPLPASLDGSFTGIGGLDALGTALRSRLQTVAGTAQELSGLEKAPFSLRFWGYLRWAADLREKFLGNPVVPAAVLYDRDGTPLSAIPFLDVFNQCHRSWHGIGGATSTPTPGFESSAGQLATAGGVGLGFGEEFLKFHRDHNELFFRWLERQGQPAVREINMSAGWPRAADAANNPSTWTEPDVTTWINEEGGDTDLELQAKTSVDDIGGDIGGFHVSGHGANTDIGPLSHNNYVPRFFAWHGSIDSQWWWREPRFARWNAATGLRERVFAPVLASGADWPGMHALTIVRDPGGAGDTVSPAGAVAGLDLGTGAGTLRVKLLARDPYDRPLSLVLAADVFDDGASTTVPVETVSHSFSVGPGADFELDTEFTVDFAFAQAFLSDDPGGLPPAAVGFANSRIRVSGTLTVTDGSDPGFVHRDFTDLHLVQEKAAPQVDVYLDISAFSEEQVQAATSGGEARFAGAVIVALQDRTAPPSAVAWPPLVAEEVKGLIRGRVPAAGLFDAPWEPDVVLWRDTSNTPFTGVTLERSSGPLKEDASLPDNLPQRFTYRYDVVFAAGHDAFAGLAPGESRLARLRVGAVDRAGNGALQEAPVQLMRAQNPFMRDGDPSWLSIDTRVFRMFEGDARFDGVALAAGQPRQFLQAALAKLNDPTLPQAQRDSYFTGLDPDAADAALEYSTQITNHDTGVTRQVYNFALAKVRLQGVSGASNVRAFFRLFRYTASNLIFDESTGYRTHQAGSTRVPLLGFTPGGELSSIPFFAAARVAPSADMRTQTDPENVRSFPAGSTDEQVIYFGVYLDINQPAVRLPATRIPAHPDGGFTAAETQPIRTLMTDAHQCMVVEIRYDGDPTAFGATPAGSDNLAQRNLVILTTDNPGATLTHTVQHSFEVDQGCCRTRRGFVPTHALAGVVRTGTAPSPGDGAHRHGGDEDGGHADAGHDHGGHDQGGHGHDGNGHAGHAAGDDVLLRFTTADRRDRLVAEEAMSLAMQSPRGGHMMHGRPDGVVDLFLPAARERVGQRFPLVFDSARWQWTGDLVDELAFFWNGLPRESRVELYLPSVRAENVLNLRNLRHAPGDVRIVDAHTLELVPSAGVTYVPLPPVSGERVAGVVTVVLPDGIRKGQGWSVDVVQVRGGEQRTTGGFRLAIQVSEAARIVDAEVRLLEVMQERLSHTPRGSRWRPVLERRVRTIRARARALAQSAGVEWKDPTSWTDPRDPGTEHPVAGPRVRVVLERVEIRDDHDPWIKGRGEIRFATRVRSRDNGGVEQRRRLPETGVYRVSGTPGNNVVQLDAEIFNGYVERNLAIEIAGTELDTFDPDDSLGRYVRVFDCACEEALGAYAPDDEDIDPENVGPWRVWYRIERA